MIQEPARAILRQHEQIAQQHAEIQKPLAELFARQLFHRRTLLEHILRTERAEMREECRRIIAHREAAVIVEPERPAETAVRQRRELRRHRLGNAAQRQRVRKLRLRKAAEAHIHATRADRVEHRRPRARHEDEMHGAFRLFQGLEQAVFRRFVHHFRIIDDDNALRREERRTLHIRLHRADDVDLDGLDRFALGMDFIIIRMRILQERAALPARSARPRIRALAQELRCHGTRHAQFPDAVRPVKQHRMRQAPFRPQLPESRDLLLMPENVFPCDLHHI